MSVLHLSPHTIEVEDIDLALGTRCRLLLHSGELELTGECTVVDRDGDSRATLAVAAWDAPAARRAIQAQLEAESALALTT